MQRCCLIKHMGGKRWLRIILKNNKLSPRKERESSAWVENVGAFPRREEFTMKYIRHVTHPLKAFKVQCACVYFFIAASRVLYIKSVVLVLLSRFEM